MQDNAAHNYQLYQRLYKQYVQSAKNPTDAELANTRKKINELFGIMDDDIYLQVRQTLVQLSKPDVGMVMQTVSSPNIERVANQLSSDVQDESIAKMKNRSEKMQKMIQGVDQDTGDIMSLSYSEQEVKTPSFFDTVKNAIQSTVDRIATAQSKNENVVGQKEPSKDEKFLKYLYNLPNFKPTIQERYQKHHMEIPFDFFTKETPLTAKQIFEARVNASTSPDIMQEVAEKKIAHANKKHEIERAKQKQIYDTYEFPEIGKLKLLTEALNAETNSQPLPEEMSEQIKTINLQALLMSVTRNPINPTIVGWQKQEEIERVIQYYQCKKMMKNEQLFHKDHPQLQERFCKIVSSIYGPPNGQINVKLQNEINQLINGYVTEKNDSSYNPLIQEQIKDPTTLKITLLANKLKTETASRDNNELKTQPTSPNNEIATLEKLDIYAKVVRSWLQDCGHLSSLMLNWLGQIFAEFLEDLVDVHSELAGVASVLPESLQKYILPHLPEGTRIILHTQQEREQQFERRRAEMSSLTGPIQSFDEFITQCKGSMKEGQVVPSRTIMALQNYYHQNNITEETLNQHGVNEALFDIFRNAPQPRAPLPTLVNAQNPQVVTLPNDFVEQCTKMLNSENTINRRELTKMVNDFDQYQSLITPEQLSQIGVKDVEALKTALEARLPQQQTKDQRDTLVLDTEMRKIGGQALGG